MDLLRNMVVAVVLVLVPQRNNYEIKVVNVVLGDFSVCTVWELVCVIFLLILALCIFAMDDSEHSRRRIPCTCEY